MRCKELGGNARLHRNGVLLRKSRSCGAHPPHSLRAGEFFPYFREVDGQNFPSFWLGIAKRPLKQGIYGHGIRIAKRCCTCNFAAIYPDFDFRATSAGLVSSLYSRFRRVRLNSRRRFSLCLRLRRNRLRVLFCEWVVRSCWSSLCFWERFGCSRIGKE